MRRNQFEIITTAIEAAIQPNLWNKLIDHFVDSFGGISGAMVVQDEHHDARISLARSSFIRNEGHEMYQRFMQREDAGDEATMECIYQLPHNDLRSELDMFGVSHLHQLPNSTMRDWQRKQFDIQLRYGMKLNTDGPWCDTLILHVDSVKRQFSREEYAEIGLLSRVATSSLKIFRVMKNLQARFNASLNALDKLGISCLLTIDEGLVIHKNKSAQILLDKNDGLNLTKTGHFTSFDGYISRVIQRSCEEIYKTAKAEAFTSDVVLAVERPSGGPSYIVSINPVIDINAELETGLRSALIFIIDPSDSKNVSTVGLTKLGKLTIAESEVCALVVRGFSTGQISDIRNVSKNTIQQQIKHILNKLNCRNRVELLRMAIDTHLPIL